MSAKVTVMKFGGTSLEDASAFDRAARIVGSSHDKACVVVVSAMSRMTDALLLSARLATRGVLDEAVALLEEQVGRHSVIANCLGPKEKVGMLMFIHKSCQEIRELLFALNVNRGLSARSQDQITSYGEQLSARLMTAMLVKHGLHATYVDARRCILTNEEHGAAQPLFEETCQLTRAELGPLLETQKIPVLGGFFAAAINGATTTLGRGSSDYTATLVSAALGARETQIWTDVNGILTADPAVIDTAHPVSWLSYDEAAELARFGARVLHPKTIQPAAEYGIPLRVCNSRAPEMEGTLISAAGPDANGNAMKAVAHKSGMTLIDFVSSPAFIANGFRNAIEEIFHQHRATVDIVVKSENGASLICESTKALPLIVEDLEKLGSVRVQEDLTVICCVGAAAPKLQRALTAIDPTLTWHPASSVSSIVLVPAERVRKLVLALHEQIATGARASRGPQRGSPAGVPCCPHRSATEIPVPGS